MPCLLLHQPVTPAALGAEFETRGHITGPAAAPVTIVVFANYECPDCAFLDVSLRQIRQTHPADVRLVFVNTPIAGREKDPLAFQAAEAADLQGKYWEMHDLLYEKQSEWISLNPTGFRTWIMGQVKGLGLEEGKFRSDFDSPAVVEKLQEAVQAAASQTISPPVLFVNSTSPYHGLADFASLDTVVRMEALTARQFSACPDWTVDQHKQYIVMLQTSKGEVVLELYADKAPLAVNNFLFLARQGWYDGITFYRVVSDQIVQSGDPSETGMGNPGYLFATEIPAGLSFDQPGMVALDNSGVNTNGSRFFITMASLPRFDGQYTIFGKVISGLDVLAALTARDPKPGIALPGGDELIRTSIEER